MFGTQYDTHLNLGKRGSRVEIVSAEELQLIHRALFLAAIGLCGHGLFASTLYYNQAQWQSAVTAVPNLALANVSFANSDWSSSFQASRSYDSLTSTSTTAVSNGMSISAVSGYSPLGVANNALLGQASNGVWTDTISKYGSTTFNFSQAIYGFGGDFDITGANGLEIIPGSGTPFITPDGIYDGFIGFLSPDGVTSLTITWGDNGNCSECFGNSYTLSDFQLAPDPPIATPEPNFKYAFAGMLVLLVSYHFLKR